jgi:regulator of protease activity HflC (stomatin/prohibitin superfamily)
MAQRRPETPLIRRHELDNRRKKCGFRAALAVVPSQHARFAGVTGADVVSFAPQPVITEDNLVVHIDTVLYFQVTDPRAATYEIANFIQAIEQLTVTTLRNVIGGMDLEGTLASREQINAELRGILDEATGKWASGSTGSN